MLWGQSNLLVALGDWAAARTRSSTLQAGVSTSWKMSLAAVQPGESAGDALCPPKIVLSLLSFINLSSLLLWQV